jgi:hypothetical protein
MKKAIIAVRGVSNVGKTTTICMVFETLRVKFSCLAPGGRASKEVRGAVLRVDAVEVGFVSVGDRDYILEELLVPLIDRGCPVLVCATHTSRSKTVQVVERLAADHGYEIVWIDKPSDEDHELGNQRKAEEVIAEVHDAVKRAQPPGSAAAA